MPAVAPHARLAPADLSLTRDRVTLGAGSHGAKPVRGGKGTGHHWIEQTHYGTEPNDILHRIMVEWCGWGYADPTHNGIWFALPELFG